MRRHLAVALAVVAATGCYRTRRYPAPPPPAPILPQVALGGAPGPGLGRVVLDVADGAAVVEQIRGGTASAVAGGSALSGSLEIASRVCVTPCVLDVAPGPHQLRFTLVDDETRTSTGFVNVDGQPGAYRHAIGLQRDRAWRGFVGWPLLALGSLVSVAMVSGLATGDVEAHGPNLVGGGVSLGLAALGGWLVWTSTIEEQPGSGVAWHF